MTDAAYNGRINNYSLGIINGLDKSRGIFCNGKWKTIDWYDLNYHVLGNKGSTFGVDDSTGSETPPTGGPFTGDMTLLLGAAHKDYKPQHGCKEKIYGSKMSSNNTIQRYFGPALRKSDGKPGLYDTIDKKFYTNDGSGEFIPHKFKKKKVIIVSS